MTNSTSSDNAHNFRVAILDETTFNPGDLDLEALVELAQDCQRYPNTSAEQRLERLEGIDVAIANKVVFDRELLAQCPQLKAILLTATGMDNIDLEACEEMGIATYNVTNYGTPSVAQHVLMLILALSTSLNDYQTMTRNGGWSKSEHFSSLQFPIRELAGKTIGLVGYGTLAKGVERIARAFDMNVLIAARAGADTVPDGRLLLDDLLPLVDVLSLHCPLTAETHKLINREALEKMKSDAILINTARGAVVDNEELAQALRDGVIAGAGIDVLEQEPPPADHPLLAADIPNLIVTPHVAWAAIEARQRVVNKTTQNLRDWLSKQEQPENETVET
ncbi:2-hydroxyacid dehydrogenase [Cocleimonas flava]|uniref:Glycerate dehydrogenase n=1 Tax=Cocleimonas flava TaxID=634765 RepID=A0A4R1F1D7_9GAMM|nr:D-2-hydroxyacid dehydrogenase [Cocleimonas flava]TCJ87120.1 glycerate dehydrogenase [Cocleimonas flava]